MIMSGAIFSNGDFIKFINFAYKNFRRRQVDEK